MSAFVQYAGWPILEDRKRLMRIVLLGAPGSGKGTQAALLEKHMDIPHISTGVLVRSAVKEETSLGRQITTIMDSGELVPADLTLALLDLRLTQSDAEAHELLASAMRATDEDYKKRGLFQDRFDLFDIQARFADVRSLEETLEYVEALER